jgi:hypothetical protein
MRLINSSGIPEEQVWQVAQIAGVYQYEFVVVLDTAVNSVKADSAKLKLTEYRSKGWRPPSSWETDATGESDIHACTVYKGIIKTQQIPLSVKEAIVDSDLLVYVDGTWTTRNAIDFVLTFAHELRHAWQFYNVPVRRPRHKGYRMRSFPKAAGVLATCGGQNLPLLAPRSQNCESSPACRKMPCASATVHLCQSRSA